jgi:hypothetical protein
MTVPASRETTAVLDITVSNVKPWSPESPFLYHLAVSTGTDSADTRFGMRTIGWDLTPMGNKMILNGQPYMLLGTNIAHRRFLGDSLRGALPFDENWIRTIYRKFKSANWNSARFHLGLAQEQWYRIADEEGFLIQDEYPNWGLPSTVKTSELITEFTEWVNDRANHPSVFCWDAANESNNIKVDSAGLAMQPLDPQNRPWNFGYDHPAWEGLREDHPYPEGGGIASRITPVNWNFTPSKKTPVNFNELAWLWLTRQGNPSAGYVTDPDKYKVNYDGAYQLYYPTVDSRRLYRYRMSSAGVERFRMGSDMAGLMDFCGLTGSPNSSDHWYPDITNPQFTKEFLAYMPDAFSPLMVGINTGFAPRAPGSSEQIQVVLVNDSYQAWSGPVTLQMQKKALITWKQSQNATVAALSKTAVTFSVTYPVQSPQICRLQASIDWNGKRLRSVRDVPIGNKVLAVMPQDICDCDTDATAPTTVSNLRSTSVGSNAIHLAWSAASDAQSGIGQYDVYRNDTMIAFAGDTTFADSGLAGLTTFAYRVAAVNKGCVEGAKTAALNVTTTVDQTPPTIISVTSYSDTKQIVRFSEPVDKASAETAANYTIDKSASVTSAVVDANNPAQVILTTSALASGATFTLTINNVKDKAATPNVITAGSHAAFAVNCSLTDLALWKTVQATSSMQGFAAYNVVDGNMWSEWQSVCCADTQSFTIDLGTSYYVNKAVIHWGGAYPKEYYLRIQNGASGWTDVRHQTNGVGGDDTTSVGAVASKVMMYGVKRGTQWAYEMYEFEVLGTTCGGGGDVVPQLPRPISLIPKTFELAAASPNPFTRTAQIKFGVPFDSKVSIKLYDISGRVAKTLVNGPTKAGYHTVLLDGYTDNSRVLANGYYFCRMKANGFVKVEKLVKMK